MPKTRMKRVTANFAANGNNVLHFSNNKSAIHLYSTP
jgi:hypothetical protein